MNLRPHRFPAWPFILAGLAACSAPPREAPPLGTLHPAARPNVVMIMLDTLRADALGSYGNPMDTSPALDALAEAGVQFDSVLSQSPWTRPSIGSFLTSKYPRQLGIYSEEGDILQSRFTTLAEVLQEAGYTTIGLTANPNINTTFNFQQGFNEYVDSNVVFGWMDTPKGGRKRGATSLPPAPSLFERAYQLTRGDEFPYYLQINVMEPHEWVIRREGADMLRDEYAGYFTDQRYAKYYQLTRQLTDDIGKFVKRILRRPGWEDTLFIFVSDHGEGLGDHPSVELSQTHGRTLYESVLNVPWIMYQPGWTPARQRIDLHVRLLELMPTTLDFLGIPAPEGLEGVSLMPIVRGETDSVAVPPMLVAESSFRESEKIAVYGALWKYLEHRTPQHGLDPEELQARGKREDGYRTNQLADHPDAARAMAAFMGQWEAAYMRAAAERPEQGLSEDERERLEAIGYMD